MTIYDYQVKDAQGNVINMKDYEGKVLLIVNTATGCGFTPQYEGLEKLYKKYRNKGFEILDFPCNQFGNQAPGSNEEIHEFCQLTYDTSFKLFSKVDVNGENQEPLFQHLKNAKRGFPGNNIKWNFTKFLVDRNGKVVGRFSPTMKPEKFEDKISNII